MTTPKRKYLRIADLRARYNTSAMWVERKMATAGFPKPVHLGGRDRFWILDEVERWDKEMIERGVSLHGIAAKRSA